MKIFRSLLILFLMFVCLPSFAVDLSNITEDGTTIFLRQNGRQGIFARTAERITGSKLTHVAIYLNGYVYESMSGGPRKISLQEYCTFVNKKIAKHPRKKQMVECIVPKVPYSDEQLSKMITYAEQQFGRPYNVTGLLRNKKKRGMHCGQYVGNILAQSGEYQTSRWMETPVKIYNSVK